MKNLKSIILVKFYLCCLLFFIHTSFSPPQLFAQCDNVIPNEVVDLSAAADATSQITITGNGQCCSGQGNSANCVQVNITLNSNSESFSIDACGENTPCSIELFPSVGCPVANGQGICDAICTTGTDVSILLCKPGSFNEILCFTGTPKPDISVTDSEIAETCNTDLLVAGMTDITWSSAEDPTLANIVGCTSPVGDCGIAATFEYDPATFGTVTACGGVDYTYTVNGTADSDCSAGPVSASVTVTVYPDIVIDEIAVACTNPGNDEVTLTAMLSGAGAACTPIFEWTQNGTVVGTNSSSLVVAPQDGLEYCVAVSQNSTIAACAVQTACAIATASCCAFDVTCPAVFDGGTLECYGDLPPPFTTEVELTNLGFIISGACGVAVITSTDDPNPNTGCAPNGTVINRVYTIFDDENNNGVLDNGENSFDCPQTFTLIDETPPTITCPTNVNQNITAGTCGAVVPNIAPVMLNDNCGATTLTYILTGATIGNGIGDASGTTFNIGTTTVTYIALDACNNTANCSFEVTIIDNEAPFFDCINLNPINVDAGANCEGTNVSLTPPVATDNCDGNITATGVRGDALALNASYPLGTTIITWTFTDNANNQSTCTQNVVVVDNTPPVFDCTNLNPINADADANCEATGINPTAPVATDNCDGNITATGVRGDALALNAPYPLGTTIITWTFTDNANNAISCTQNVVVVDNTPPVFDCTNLNPINVNADNNCEGTNVSLTPPVAIDNCDGNITATGVRGDALALNAPYPLGTTIITWTFTDNANNAISCTQNVVVVDNTPPVFDDCNTNELVFCNDETVSFPAPMASDNCGATSVVQTNGGISGSVFPVGDTQVCFEATDGSNNSTSCCFMVKVLPPIQLDATATPAYCNANNDITYEFTLNGGLAALNGSDYTISASAIAGNPVLTPTTGNNSQVFSLNLDANTPLGTIINILVTDEQGCNQNFSYTTDFQCCIADAGVLMVTLDCPEDDATILISGYETDPTYSTYIVITDANGLILDIISPNNTGEATIPYADWDNYLGTDTDYLIYSYNVLNGAEPFFDLTIGLNISEIGMIDEGCFDFSNEANLYVPAPLNLSCDGIVTNGGQGGISPFYFNIYEVCFSGGTPPYSYAWETDGYVRQAILFDAATGIVTIRVIYSDHATWAVTVTDHNGCNFGNNNVFTNDPGAAGDTGAILDIYTYAVTSATTGAGCSNGSISSYAEGGDGNYTFTWSGPNTWNSGNTFTTGGSSSDGVGNNNVSTISNLPEGWYSVTVTDGLGEETMGWYWVTCETPGRGKTAAIADPSLPTLTAAPNPFKQQTSIQFESAAVGQTTVAVYTISGQKIATLFDATTEANIPYQVRLDASQLSSKGIYLLQITDENGQSQFQKLLFQ